MDIGVGTTTGAIPTAVVVDLLDAAAAERPELGEEVARLLSRSGLSADEVAEIDAAVRRFSASSDRWRRRGQELAALFSTARELAQLRDIDELLDRLVERAHDLVGTDVTYLSEFHVGSRELVVRTTLGTVAPTFPGLRVPAGMGLASMVVENRRPCWTSSYAGMTQAPHDSGIDAAVADEGLVSLLGVPLLAGDEVIGVLFAANRVEHTFSPEEISLLSAFADHAAVVLQTARLLARTQHAAEETRSAYGQLARQVEAMERASEVHTDLTALVLEGGDATDVAAAVGKALQARVTILDADLIPAAGSADAELATADERGGVWWRGVLGEAIAQSRQNGRCVVLTEPAGAVVVAVVAGSTLLGALLLEQGVVKFGPVEFRTAERAAQITALLSLKQDAVVEAERRVRGDLLADMLSDDRGRAADIDRRARARGVRLADLCSVIVVSVTAEQRRHASRAAGRVVEPSGLVGEHAEWVVALSPTPDAAAATAEVHTAVTAALVAPVLAVGATFDGSSDLRTQVDASAACARVLPSIGITDIAGTADEYLPYTALFGPGEVRVEAFVRAVIGPVLDWDADRGATLTETLATYLDCRMSPVATARALHVHKNTVLQRLERVTELLGDRWQAPDHLFRLQVAVRVARLKFATRSSLA